MNILEKYEIIAIHISNDDIVYHHNAATSRIEGYSY